MLKLPARRLLALVIAQTHFVVEARQCEIVLLVDEPAAELDADYRKRLFELLRTVPAQMFVAALEPADLPLADTGRRFHVEHGEVIALV